MPPIYSWSAQRTLHCWPLIFAAKVERQSVADIRIITVVSARRDTRLGFSDRIGIFPIVDVNGVV